MNKKKIILAKLFDLLKINELFFFLRRIFYGNEYIYAINYHNTSLKDIQQFEKQLNYYSSFFSNVSKKDLDDFLCNGVWNKDKPGLIISFDDGLRNNFDVACKILEKYNFTGWFFISVGFVDCEVSQQKKYAKEHSIISLDEYPDNRIAMSWDEVRYLNSHHVVGCHTMTHHRMIETTSIEKINREIKDSKTLLESKLNSEIDIFCWVGGEEFAYSKYAAQAIKDSGYKYSFMTNCCPITKKTNKFQLQRNNVESNWSLLLVKFVTSGFMDLLYFRKRCKVNKKTSV
ncbi:polysaccharide deacetylase family protein [Photobacterium damselae]|uniref:polysaccharide deacetylase family protein n=1 Tax=Photobacterium damselae TaxID=38293 RepID=UPI00254293E0